MASELDDVLREHPDGTVVIVRAVPGARSSEITGVHEGALRLRIAAPAVDGKANQALVATLAASLGVRKRQIEILKGEHGRDKQILVSGMSVQEIVGRLS